jgi:hypothetical protein
MRRKIRAPLTDRARKGIVSDLEKIRDHGGDPEPVLAQSITRAWRGVFPLNGENKSNGGFNGKRYSVFDELEKSLAEDQDGAGHDGGISGREA